MSFIEVIWEIREALASLVVIILIFSLLAAILAVLFGIIK
jgi:hypothetical protein